MNLLQTCGTISHFHSVSSTKHQGSPQNGFCRGGGAADWRLVNLSGAFLKLLLWFMSFESYWYKQVCSCLLSCSWSLKWRCAADVVVQSVIRTISLLTSTFFQYNQIFFITFLRTGTCSQPYGRCASSPTWRSFSSSAAWILHVLCRNFILCLYSKNCCISLRHYFHIKCTKIKIPHI